MIFATTLHLAPGSGRIARHEAALLFVLESGTDLMAAFIGAAPGAELRAVASAVIESGFAVPPFVAMAWSTELRVMAFGDLAVETDQPSLPMLSGAGSRTWVEHTLTDVTAATVDVRSDDVDATTDLAAGVALAGGFRLLLQPNADLTVHPTPTPLIAPPRAPEPAAADDPTPVIAGLAPPRVAVSAPPPAVAPTPPVIGAHDDPSVALAAIRSAAMSSDGTPLHPTDTAVAAGQANVEDEVATTDHRDFDADVTIPPAEMEVTPAPDGSGSLVEARLCPRHHANAPTAASCAMCGELIAPGTPAVNVVRPSLGRLALDDGTLVELDAELLIGRQPDRDSDVARASLRRIALEGEKVSRSHLEVRFRGWDVLVVDCHSTNGTFVVAHRGGQVARLDAGRPQMVEEGAVVYFGSRSFTVQGRESQ